MPLPKKVFLFILQNYCAKIQKKEPLVSILTLFLVSLRNNNYV